MKFVQYYLDCLSHASYLIGDPTSGRAVVVDPQRDVSEYLADAAESGLTIEMIIETHFHADFLSGHLELAAATGADIVYSAVAEPEFAHRSVADGERHSLGSVELEFRHTPGHTPESMSIVVYENAGAAPYGVLTGDTLFPEEVPFEAALERLRTVEDVPGYLALEGGGASSVGRQVLQLDRRIDLSVEACFRLAVPGFPSPGVPELRLLFAAGLVAAGVEPPQLPATCEPDLHEAA